MIIRNHSRVGATLAVARFLGEHCAKKENASDSPEAEERTLSSAGRPQGPPLRGIHKNAPLPPQIRDKGALTSAVPLLFRLLPALEMRCIGRGPALPTDQRGSERCSEGIPVNACLLPCTKRQLSGNGVKTNLSSSLREEYGENELHNASLPGQANFKSSPKGIPQFCIYHFSFIIHLRVGS